MDPLSILARTFAAILLITIPGLIIYALCRPAKNFGADDYLKPGRDFFNWLFKIGG